MTLATAQRDLAATVLDIDRLDAIIANLELFIREGGEDRSVCKTDLLKYKVFRDQGLALKKKIHAVIKQHEENKASK